METPPISDRTAIRRTSLALLLAQSIASAALLTSSTVNPIVSARLSGQDALAGLPTALVLAGASLAAYPAGQIMSRFGRRRGLALGSAVGVIGAVVAALSIMASMLPGFWLGLFLLGAGRGTLDQGRYAAAEVNPPEHRARAVSLVIFGGTIGAVLGPVLVSPASQWAESTGLDPLSGPYLGTAILLGVVGAVLSVLLPGNLRDIARRVAQRHHEGDHHEEGSATSSSSNPAAQSKRHARSFWEILRAADSRAAIVAMTCAQAAMVMMMAIIGLHMTHHEHELSDVSLVTSVHVLGMFMLSPVMGHLADRLGRRTMITISAGIMAAGCVVAPLSLYTPWIALALFLVGLGWSGCFVTGSTLLTDSLAPHERARTQGANDAFVNIASAAGGLSSGMLLQAFGFNVLAMIGLCISLTPLLAVIAYRPTRQLPEPEQALAGGSNRETV